VIPSFSHNSEKIEMDVEAALARAVEEGYSPEQMALLKYVAETGSLPPVSGNLEEPGDSQAERIPWGSMQKFLHRAIHFTLLRARNTPVVQPILQDYDMECNYLLEQFDHHEAAPFTLQRLCEVLVNPQQYHLRPDPANPTAMVLRGDVLQAAIRRCVLVACIDF
jgi:hypothetical protein